jgi:hypothetical protein
MFIRPLFLVGAAALTVCAGIGWGNALGPPQPPFAVNLVYDLPANMNMCLDNDFSGCDTNPAFRLNQFFYTDSVGPTVVSGTSTSLPLPGAPLFILGIPVFTTLNFSGPNFAPPPVAIPPPFGVGDMYVAPILGSGGTGISADDVFPLGPSPNVAMMVGVAGYAVFPGAGTALVTVTSAFATCPTIQLKYNAVGTGTVPLVPLSNNPPLIEACPPFAGGMADGLLTVNVDVTGGVVVFPGSIDSFLAANPIPEPGSAFLCIAGFLGCACWFCDRKISRNRPARI